MSKHHPISIHLTEDPARGETAWSYSVQIKGGFHKIGTGHDFASALGLARSGIKSAKRYLENLSPTELDDAG
jgi:hypothetical protein